MDMVRFAVVGTSAITARFLDALALEQGAVLHAVYSRTKQRAQAFGAQYGARAYYDSLPRRGRRGRCSQPLKKTAWC